MSRPDHVKQFYLFLSVLEERIGGARRLADCSGWMSWPKRGVYFFMEGGETRTDSGTGPRVVRVGTHALIAGAAATLWKRLYQHRGPLRSGGGNHRGSVFRMIVGTALSNRDGFDSSTWNEGRTASRDVREREHSLEQAVSKVIGDMSVLWLAIGDDPGPNSLRGYLERNAIALLSNYRKQPIDPASHSWLGHHCKGEKVRTSGLWNSDYVDRSYEPEFLDTLQHLVSQTEGSE